MVIQKNAAGPEHKVLHCRVSCNILYKDQLSLTNPRDALHHGERAANKSGGRSV